MVGFLTPFYGGLTQISTNFSIPPDTEYHEFIVRPDVLEVLPQLVERYGKPYADSSCIPTYYVAKMARQQVTVALNGDGGDELFAGYERYKAVYLARLYHKLPKLLTRGVIEPMVFNFPCGQYQKRNLGRLKRFFKGALLPFPGSYLRWIAVVNAEIQSKLYTREFANRVALVNPERIISAFFQNTPGPELLDTLLCIDTNTYLPNDLLVKIDIATMANSLEARSPFLDHRLIEFVVSLKADFKMRRLIKKYLLKQMIKDFVPREIIHRPKMGFGIPLGSWFRGELKGLLTGTLLSDKSLGKGVF